jgi:two-component system, NtrC family, sensor histidine kinase HydH
VAADYFQSLKDYVGFTDDSSALLQGAYGQVAPHVAIIIDDFYDTIEAHPGASRAITGGHAQIERLKQSLRRWLEDLFRGPHDQDYFERRSRIGRMHVRIDLPQAYMFTAMNRIRIQVSHVLREALAGEPERLSQLLVATHQIMDMELAIMLETYREDLVAKNRKAERLATIGEFAAGIGHELRNPLGVVESSLFLLRQHLSKTPLDPKAARHLDKIGIEVKRSNDTITALLELARNRPPQPRTIDMAGLLRSALAAANLPAGVEVSIGAPADLQVSLDPEQITRVITNLLINASQAMGERGQIWLEAERGSAEIRIRVRDSGPGVPAEARGRIFEALFTTKAKGSGLGLALCRRIADAHAGTIMLEPPTPGHTGASFLLTVPDRAPGGATP